ncbi:putative RNA-directed DNA polymerase from transposon BS [Trichonephila clavipes]|nr:putative RNA-directed DNA polymerase from transposon BS [Trichonephila clavipes]
MPYPKESPIYPIFVANCCVVLFKYTTSLVTVKYTTEINQINAKIRKSYAQLKRSRWRELCKNLDSRTTNSKLWRIVKKINKEQEQCEESNSVIDTNGQVFPDDKAAANGLAVYYQETSKLVFTSEDKSVMKRAKNIIHGCRTSDVGDQGLSRDFSQQELLLAMAFFGYD